MTIRPASDRSLLVCFGEEISLESHHKVAALTRSMEGARGVLNLHPAFASVLIDFDPRLRTHDDVEALVRERMPANVEAAAFDGRTMEIPVQYGGEFGPDLAHSVRLDQYYPNPRAVAAYHLSRHAEFGDYIPPSTSVVMER